jgi:hypothetical protein
MGIIKDIVLSLTPEQREELGRQMDLPPDVTPMTDFTLLEPSEVIARRVVLLNWNHEIGRG